MTFFCLLMAGYLSIIMTRTTGGRTNMPRKIILSLLFLFCVGLAQAQSPSDIDKSEEKEKLRKAAVEFLRETMAEVNSMRSLENRLSFGAELASLMWFHDEKEGRAIYMGVTSDFRHLLFEFDTELNKIAAAEAAEDQDESDNSSIGLFGPNSAKFNLERKLQKALEMRQQIALSLAEHEPDLALAFYYDSVAGLSSKELVARAKDRDSGFEFQLMSQVAESNAAKAAQFGAKSLDKGFSYQHLELLKKVYAKDPEKGIEFAQAVVSHFKSGKADKDKDEDLWVLNQLIEFGESTASKTAAKPDKKPLLTTQELRDMTEIMARQILAGEGDNEGMVTGLMDTLEKYTPTRATQVKAKFRAKNVNIGSASNSAVVAANAISTAANAMANAATAAPDPALERRAKAAEERLAAERKLMEQIGTMVEKKLPAEERNKIVEQARKLIAKSGGADKKIVALSMLASQVSKAGDKELAVEIMKDAESLTNPNPKNYHDYILNWMLITGYAQVDAEKAFPKLNDTILRLNGTIEAFVKAAEFIDARGEMIDDGEVQVGQFGGSMLRGLTKELKIAEPTLRNLARADFSKTKAAANAFDRTEARVLAKILIIRTVLSEKEGQKDVDIFEMFSEIR
jgi:hypothetical protein